MKSVVYIGSVLGMLVASSGDAVATPPQSLTYRAQLERLLSSHEALPNREALLRVHPQVERYLRDIVEQPNGKELARNRALTTLRLFPSAATRATLKAALASLGRAQKGVELLHAQQAVVSYAVVAKKDALTEVKPYLSHKNRDLRYSAALAVRLTGHADAEKVLAAQLQTETAPMIRHQLQSQITLLKKVARPVPRIIIPETDH